MTKHREGSKKWLVGFLHLESNEKNLGKPISQPYLAPRLVDNLTEKGFTFTNEISDADYIIQLKAQTREGSEVFGQFSTFVDFSISATNLIEGKKIFQKMKADIKGLHLSYQKAGLKAFETAQERLSEQILPELITALSR